MRTLLIGFIIFLCWMFFCRWQYVCKIRNQCGYQTEVKDVRPQTLNLVDNGEVVLKGYDQFKFANNSYAPVINENNNDFIEKVAAFMRENPGKKLTITGNYLPSEVDKTGETSYGMFENIGLARADAIRKLLVAKGINENRMLLDHNLLSEKETSLDEPISFRTSGEKELANNDTDGTPDEYEQGGQAFSFTNMSFSDANFTLGSADFRPGAAFRSYADSVKTYMGLNEGKSLNLIGHTCDKGSDQFNMELGKKRAKSVKRYFEKLGIKANINTASKGENQPAYPNTNEPNRSKNRRVVVQIQ